MFRQTTVCREGWYYLAIVAVGARRGRLQRSQPAADPGRDAAGIAAAELAGGARPLNGLKIERQLPSRLCAGDVLSVNLSLTNTRPRLGSWGVVVEEQIQRESIAKRGNGNHRRQPPLRPSVLFPYVEAGQSRKGVYRGRLPERGRYRFGPLRLSTRFPFGLFSRTITAGEPETLIVLPRLGRLTEGWTSRRLEAFAGTHRRQRPGRRGRFLRRPRMARRRRPAADPLAQFRPARPAGGAPVRAAADPRRGRGARPVAARAPGRPKTPRTWSWPSVSPPRCWPTYAARAAATFTLG